eukprot:179460-Chlamydomonas_euryale.AAC.5
MDHLIHSWAACMPCRIYVVRALLYTMPRDTQSHGPAAAAPCRRPPAPDYRHWQADLWHPPPNRSDA